MQQPSLASRVFGIRLHAPAGHDPSPMHFPLGSLAESPRYPERAPIIVGPCPYKLPGHIPPFGSPRTWAPRVDDFSVVGPNIRAQPVDTPAFLGLESVMRRLTLAGDASSSVSATSEQGEQAAGDLAFSSAWAGLKAEIMDMQPEGNSE